MHRARRVVLFLSNLLTMGVLSGCICTGVQPIQYRGAIFDGMSNAEVEAIARLTFDANDVLQGQVSPEDFKSRYQTADSSVDIRPLPNVFTSYVLITDNARLQQTLILPGTANAANLASDLDLDLVVDPDLGIAVHRGFQLNARAVRADVRASLADGYPLTISGYSLGGATAVLVGALLQQDGITIANITTFGQPKVTNTDGSLVLQKRLPLHRFIAGDDPVTTYPGEPFVHCGDAVMLLDGPNFVRLEFGSEPFRLFDQLVVPVTESSLKVHGTYSTRVAAKTDGALIEIPYSDRSCYSGGP